MSDFPGVPHRLVYEGKRVGVSSGEKKLLKLG
jgi:hypothetical protein